LSKFPIPASTGNRGAVTFESLGTDTTRLTVVMEYEPEGFLEKAGDILGVPSAQVEDSLKSFRELIESKNTATAGWRGRIDSADPEVTGNNDMAPEPATTSASGIGASTEAETYREATPKTETQAGEDEAGPTVPHSALQAVPVTHHEAGAHEARTLAPVSDREEVSGTGPVVIKLNDPEPETAKPDRSEGFRSNTLWGPGKEEIARRAYELYLARGQGAGHEMDDWIEAERQLLEERNPES
jgi:hypothetical protein